KVLPKHWAVDRTIGWLGRYRRLSMASAAVHPARPFASLTPVARIRPWVQRLAPGQDGFSYAF
ncbi:MAG: IS4/IS5 family transposase, partial [Planctomycetota bacterium]